VAAEAGVASAAVLNTKRAGWCTTSPQNAGPMATEVPGNMAAGAASAPVDEVVVVVGISPARKT